MTRTLVEIFETYLREVLHEVKENAVCLQNFYTGIQGNELFSHRILAKVFTSRSDVESALHTSPEYIRTHFPFPLLLLLFFQYYFRESRIQNSI